MTENNFNFLILKDKKGKLQKILTVLAISLLVLLILIGINTAENITKDSSEKIPLDNQGDSSNSDDTGNLPAQEDVKEPESETDTDEASPPIDLDSSDLNPGSGSESSEKVSDGNGTLNEDELSNDDSITLPEKNESEPIPSNVTEENNNTLNEPQEPVQENNDSSSSGSGTISEPAKDETPKLEIEFSHPSKITRGEIIEITAVITNSGSKANNVLTEWIFPEYFEIVSGNEIESCGTLKNKESCSAEITVQTSTSTSLGNNEIKISVSYEK